MANQYLTIKQLTAAVGNGLTPRMVRHYHKLGLLPEAKRSAANYRLYTDADVHTDIEVVIVYQTSISKGVEAASVSQFYGCIQDDSFIRHPQNEQPEREPLNLIQNHVFFPLSTLSYDESVKCIWRFIRLYNVPPAPRRFWHHVSTTLPNTYSLDFGQKNKFA